MESAESLDERLRRAGVCRTDDPMDAWRLLRRAEGPRATVPDLYELVARRRGLRAVELPLEERHALAHAAMPEVWPDWSTVAGSERENEPIELVDHDAEWARRFLVWQERLAAALGDVAERIEHVGSTAVPGLAAKPTVDVQVSVARLQDEDAYRGAIEALGLRLRSRDALHRFFRPATGRPREVHVHVCESGSSWEADHLVFRDHLRSNSAARDRYQRAKVRAATMWSDDRVAYTEAKTAVVLDLLADARRVG